MKDAGLFREWDELDFLGAGGMLMITASAVASLIPPLRKMAILLPIALGAAMMAAAGYGARQR